MKHEGKKKKIEKSTIIDVQKPEKPEELNDEHFWLEDTLKCISNAVTSDLSQNQ